MTAADDRPARRLIRLVDTARADARVWPAALAAVFVAEAAMMLWAGRNQWYFFDEWRLVVERVVAPGDVSTFERLFRPDGEHVIAIPLAVFVVLTSWAGLDTYVPLVIANIVVRLATLWVADDIVRRLDGRRAARLVVAVSIAFFGGGFEALFGQSVIFAGMTLVFCLLAFREAVRDDGRPAVRGALATALLTCAIFSSSYGFPAVLGVALVFAWRRRWGGAVSTLVVPPVAFLVVRRLAGGSYSDQQPVEPRNLDLYVDYVQAGLSALGEAMTGLEGLGLASYVGLVVACLLLGRGDRQLMATAAITVTVVAFYAQASLSRSVFGAEQAAATRYIFFCGVLSFVMLGAAWGARRVAGRAAIVVAVLVGLSLTSSIGRLAEGYDFFLPKMQLSRARLSVGMAAAERDEVAFVPDPEWAPDLRDERLAQVVAWSGSDGLIADGDRCYDERVAELRAAGYDVAAMTAGQRTGLVLLLNEWALGFGPRDATIAELVDLARDGATGSVVVDQFRDELTSLRVRAVGGGAQPSGVLCA